MLLTSDNSKAEPWAQQQGGFNPNPPRKLQATPSLPSDLTWSSGSVAQESPGQGLACCLRRLAAPPHPQGSLLWLCLFPCPSTPQPACSHSSYLIVLRWFGKCVCDFFNKIKFFIINLIHFQNI